MTHTHSEPHQLAQGKAWSGLAMRVHVGGGTVVLVLGKDEEACSQLIFSLEAPKKPFDPAKCYPALLVAVAPAATKSPRAKRASRTTQPET